MVLWRRERESQRNLISSLATESRDWPLGSIVWQRPPLFQTSSHINSNAQSFNLSRNICVTEKRLLLRCRLESHFLIGARARSYTSVLALFVWCRQSPSAITGPKSRMCYKEWRVDWSIDQEWRYFFFSLFYFGTSLTIFIFQLILPHTEKKKE